MGVSLEIRALTTTYSSGTSPLTFTITSLFPSEDWYAASIDEKDYKSEILMRGLEFTAYEITTLENAIGYCAAEVLVCHDFLSLGGLFDVVNISSADI